MKAPVHGDLPTINSTQVMASTGLQDEGKVGWMDGVDGLVLTVFFFVFFLLIDLFSQNGSVHMHHNKRKKKSTMAAALLLKLRLSVRVLGVFSKAMDEKESEAVRHALSW